MRYLLKALPGLLLIASLGVGTAAADQEKLLTSTRYDAEYPVIAYSGPARANRVWRLQQELNSGHRKLAWDSRFGYLPALLDALEIDVDSQVLVFSRTSLQIEHIAPSTPRAIYFNDDTYVGYVQDSKLIELTVIDAEKGAVFYGLENVTDYPPEFNREGGRCLTCHDTYAMGGGGVPRVMVLSSPVDDPADDRNLTAGGEVDDTTPFGLRWGGWYVTGSTGNRGHLGNLPLVEDRGGQKLRELRATAHNRARLDGYLDTSRYLAGHSDVVALTVLEHQTALHNLVTRVGYKVRTVMSRDQNAAGSGNTSAGPAQIRSWEDLTSRDHAQLVNMMEPLVRALFLQGAVPFEDHMAGSSGFAERFSKLGPHDSRGRSLRELDLKTRLLKYPLSFEVYSAQFDALPEFALEYIHGRIAEILQGRDTTGISASLSSSERQAITEILIDTKPALAKLLRTPQK